MKLWMLFVVFLLGTIEGFAQGHGFLVGASLGVNASGTRASTESGGMSAQPQAGWSASALALYSLTPRLNLAGQLGGIVERNVSRENFAWIDAKYQWKYSWVEATTIISYKLFTAKKFNIHGGAGFTARRIVKATMEGTMTHTDGSGNSWASLDLYDEMNKWNYLIPFQLGADFNMAGGGVMQINTEFQWGVRERYLPRTPILNENFDFGSGVPKGKLYSLSLKVAYLIPLTD